MATDRFKLLLPDFGTGYQIIQDSSHHFMNLRKRSRHYVIERLFISEMSFYPISIYFRRIMIFKSSFLAKCSLEQFSIECRKTKTKVITTANQNKDKYHNEPMRTQSKYT